MANLGITLHYVITWPPSMHWFWELAVENSTRNLLSTLKIKVNLPAAMGLFGRIAENYNSEHANYSKTSGKSSQ